MSAAAGIWNGWRSTEKPPCTIVLPAALSSKPDYKPLGKYAYGEVVLKEGSRLNAVVRGISKKNRAELLEKLPVKVKAGIYQRDGYKTVVFDLDE